MEKSDRMVSYFALCSALFFLAVQDVKGRVPFPVAKSYEDSVRILILFNHTTPIPPACSDTTLYLTQPGPQTLAFVLNALDGITNIVVHRAPYSTLDTVKRSFPGKLPHVIVHVNAGWGGSSGLHTARNLSWAVSRGIGVVEIGDDDVYILTSVFTVVDPRDSSLLPWIRFNHSGGYEPMTEAAWLNKSDDTLWVRLQPSNDHTGDSTRYPFFKGIVRNTVFNLLHGDTTLVFKPAGVPYGRCESDPDAIILEPGYEQYYTALGYQQGYNAAIDAGPGGDPATAPVGIFGQAGQWDVIRVLQDSLPDSVGVKGVRRAVSVAIQPQFLKDSVAAMQIIYDAIMFASLIHQLNPPIPGAGINQKGGRAARLYGVTWQPGERMRICDMSGRRVFEGYSDAIRSFETERFRVGIYFISTTVSNVVTIKKFMLLR